MSGLGPADWLLVAIAALLLAPRQRRSAAPLTRRLARTTTRARAGPPGEAVGPPAVVVTGQPAPSPARFGPQVLSLMAAGAVVGGGAVFGGLIGGVIALPPAMAVAVLVRRLREQEALTAGEPLSGLPLALDLIAVALRAGAPTPLALAVVADAVTGELRARLAQVAGLLRLGADPAQAWSAVRGHPDLAAVAVVAMRSADSGIRLADAFERQAEQLRDNGRSEAIARAHRVATFGLLPLGTCFLPAFVCLGIVPIVAGVAGEVFGPIAR